MNYTVDQIVSMLHQNPSDKHGRTAVERAILAIHDRQTRDEKQASDTKHRNDVGFSVRTVHKGTYYARWILSGKHLTGEHAAKAKQIALYHRKQLTNIANKKI